MPHLPCLFPYCLGWVAIMLAVVLTLIIEWRWWR